MTLQEVLKQKKFEQLFTQFGEDEKIVIKQGLEDGLTIEQVKKFAKKEYNYLQMGVIATAIKQGIENSKTDLLLNSELDHQQMSVLYNEFVDDKLTLNELHYLIKLNLSWHEMEVAVGGIKLYPILQTLLPLPHDIMLDDFVLSLISLYNKH